MVSFSQLDSALEAAADLERCARFLDLEGWIVMRLRQCEQETTLNTTTAGRPLSAIFVRHCTAPGPAAVPVQLTNHVTTAAERARAMQSTWMASLYGLNLGGGASSVLLDPGDYSETELRLALQRIGGAISGIGAGSIIYPLNLNAFEMQWLSARPEASSTKTEDLAFGLLELIRGALTIGAPHPSHLAGVGSRLRDLRVSIQGFDPIAQRLARQLHDSGARIVAIADASGGLRDPLGLDPAALVAHERSAGMLLGYSGAEAVVNADILESDCDLLVLSSVAHQVTPLNAARIRARIIVEGIPQAIAAESKPELSSAGKLIVSDLLCGGLQMLYHCTESERAQLAAPPHAFLRRSIRHMWKQLQQAASRWQLPLPVAAETLAVQRVADTIRIQGK